MDLVAEKCTENLKSLVVMEHLTYTQNFKGSL